MSMHEKMRLLHYSFMEAANQADVTIIIDRMYVIDRETGAVSTMQIMNRQGPERSSLEK